MIKILIDEKTQKIFWFLWKNRKEPYTIRETAQHAGVSYGSTWSILKEFEKLGIVYGFEKKKSCLYVLNFENPLCFHVWSLLNALKREHVSIESGLKEKINQLKEGFIIAYPENGRVRTLYCSTSGRGSVGPEEFKVTLHEKKELFDILWNEGIVLAGEKRFYTFMWELTEKKVIGVGS